jgi:mRNA interferase RelE/StbE
MYSVLYTAQAAKQLKKLDQQTAKLIYAWIEKNLEGCENPRRLGKALAANHSNQWRYRIGDYRLLADIIDEKITILILSVGHRRDIYKK